MRYPAPPIAGEKLYILVTRQKGYLKNLLQMAGAKRNRDAREIVNYQIGIDKYFPKSSYLALHHQDPLASSPSHLAECKELPKKAKIGKILLLVTPILDTLHIPYATIDIYIPPY
jgi:hypothetical protein